MFCQLDSFNGHVNFQGKNMSVYLVEKLLNKHVNKTLEYVYPNLRPNYYILTRNVTSWDEKKCYNELIKS